MKWTIEHVYFEEYRWPRHFFKISTNDGKVCGYYAVKSSKRPSIHRPKLRRHGFSEEEIEKIKEEVYLKWIEWRELAVIWDGPRI